MDIASGMLLSLKIGWLIDLKVAGSSRIVSVLVEHFKLVNGQLTHATLGRVHDYI